MSVEHKKVLNRACFSRFRKIGMLLLFFVSIGTCIFSQNTVLIPVESTWSYLDDGTNPGTLWNRITFNDINWKTGAGKFGYGEGNEKTVLSYGPDAANKYITYLFRTQFEVVDPAKYKSLLVRLLRDDGAVVYLNGTEVVRSNMPETSSFSTLAVEGVGDVDELTYFPFTIAADKLVTGKNLIAVEIHQQAAGSSDLGFDMELIASEKSLVPLKINEVMASNAAAHLDPDFNQFVDWIELYNGGNEPFELSGFYLTDDLDTYNKWAFPSGTIVPPSGYLTLYTDGQNTGLHTNFQLSKSGERIGIFNPAGVLTDSITYPSLSPDMSYGLLTDGSSERGYFWSSTPNAKNEGGVTNFQAIPAPVFSKNAGFFSASVTVELSCSDPDATIRYTSDGSDPVPNSNRYTTALTVSSNTVLKARAFRVGYLPSTVITNTYFINEDINIAVISIGIEPDYLKDPNIGIYLDDKLDLRREWERPATFEFFEPDGTRGFLSNVDLRLFGRSAVRFPQKSFGVFIRPTNGVDGLNYPLFPNTPFTHYQSFVLRSSSDDWRNTMFRDGCLQTLYQDHVDLIHQDYRPSIVFINGIFMGIHNIRDKINPGHLATHKSIDPNQMDMVYVDNDYNPPLIDVKSGDSGAFWAMWNFITKNDMSNAANYATAETLLDMDDFIDFYCIQILVANQSWRHNCKLWRPKAGDTRFKTVVWDLDYGYQFIDRNNLSEITSNEPLVKALVKNPDFKSKFRTRLDFLSQTVFTKDRSLQYIDSLAAVIEPYIQRHADKWASTMTGVFASKAEWEQRVEVMRSFARNRPSVQDSYIRSYFGVSAKQTVNLSIAPADGGNISLNGNLLTTNAFSGSFYTGSVLSLTALPKAGYSFSGWQGLGNTSTTISPMRSAWKYLDDGTDQGTSWRAVSFDDSSWKSGNGVFGYGETSGINTTIGFGPASSNKYVTSYFRRSITLSNIAQYTGLTIQLVRDDGAVVYLNGTEVVRSNMPQGSFTYTTLASTDISSGVEANVHTFSISSDLLVEGTNVLAVEIHQSMLNSVDLRFDLALLANISTTEAVPSKTITVNQNFNLTAVFQTKRESPLVITEINYAPPSTLGDDSEFIEISNTSSKRILISGYRFEGINFTFPSNTYIEPGQYMLVTRNKNLYSYLEGAAFEWQSGDLANEGEEIVLRDGGGNLIDKVSYSSSDPWPLGIPGSGHSIELLDTGSDNNLGTSWKKSAYSTGSPGTMNPVALYRNLRINEISGIPSNSGYLGDYNWFEVTNIGNQAIDLAGYYLSNDPYNPIKYKIPVGFDSLTVIPPHGHKVFIAENTPEIGPLQVPFKLKGESGSVVIAAMAGDRIEIIDRVDYTVLGKGTTFGRLPTGTGTFTTLAVASPGKANRQVDNTILVASRIKPGDEVPLVVRLRNATGETDRRINGNFRIVVSHGTVDPDTVRIHNGMGSVMARFTADKDFEVSLLGYPYKRYVEVSKSIPVITLTGPITKPTVIGPDADYVVKSNIEVTATGNLKILPGTRLIFDEKRGISSKGRLEVTGTLDNPVVMIPAIRSTYWGGLEIRDVDSLSSFSWVMTGKGGGDNAKLRGHSYSQPFMFGDHANIEFDNLFLTDYMGKGIYTDYSELRVTNSFFARTDQGAELRFSHGEFYNTWFQEIPDNDWSLLDDDNDAIYFWEYNDVNRPHIIDNCVFYRTEDDGIDMLTASVIIRNSLFWGIYEKGLSAGYRSQVYIDRSVFALMTGGVQSSFESYLNVTNSTFYRTAKPSYSYSASGELTNCILSKHNNKYSNDSLPSFYFNHCISDSDTDLLGDFNLFGNPGLKDPDKFDFSLVSGSKSINKGNAITGLDPDGSLPDLGAYAYGHGTAESLKINEIYYHPAESQGAEIFFEFIELINISGHVMDLRDIRLAGAVEFTFPAGSEAKPGEILLIASDRFTYGQTGCQVFSWKPGALPNSSGNIKLVSGAGVLLDEVSYTDALPWSPLADGLGYSLSLNDPYIDNSIVGNWSSSYVFGGTPGLPNNPPDYNNVRINEYQILSGASSSPPEALADQWIELYNSGNLPVNVGGLYWSDESANLLKWRIPSDKPALTQIPAGGCLLFHFSGIANSDPSIIGFAVTPATRNILLTRRVGTQNITVDQVSIQFSEYPGSKGRYPNGSGAYKNYHYGSPGAPNTSGAKHLIAPRVMQVGERLPIVVMVDTLDGLVPRTISGALNLTIENGTLRSSNISLVKGAGSITTKIETAGSRIKLSVPQWTDTLGIQISSGRHLVAQNNNRRFDEVWTSEHDYWIYSSIEIPVGRKLVIMPGTRILMGRDARIEINGSLEILGTADNPVLFTSRTWAEPWGGLVFGQYAEKSTIGYTFFINGGADSGRATGHSETQAIITTTGGPVDLNHCFFIDNIGKAVYSSGGTIRISGSLISRCDAGIEAYNGRIEMDKSYVFYIPNESQTLTETKEHDGLYLDGKSVNYGEAAVISNSLIGLTTDDGIDLLNKSGAIVTDTHFYKTGDKAISVEQNKVYLERLVLESCDEGVAARQAGYAYIDHCTFYKNATALRSYSTAPTIGHGHVIVSNSILSESTVADLSKETDNELTTSYCLSDQTVLAGTGNKSGSAGFTNPGIGDFTLKSSSPAINAGDPDSGLDPDGTRPDMGAFWFDHASSGVLIISEIHYNPKMNGLGEFFEVVNASPEPVDLKGFRIEGAVNYVFEQTFVIQPGEYFLVTKMASDYSGKGFKVFQWSSGDLPNTDGTVSLYDPLGLISDQVTYSSGSPWSQWPLKYSSSLELSDLKLNNALSDSWRTSFYVGGTPGVANKTAPVEKVFINEVLARNTSSYPDEGGLFSDWLELYNGSDHFVDLNGLYLTDSKTEPKHFKIAATDLNSTLIPPGGFFVFWLDEQPQKGFRHANFMLPGAGSFTGLSELKGNSSIWIDTLNYLSISADESFGRAYDGQSLLIRFSKPTPGMPNKPPRGRLSGLYINEVMARNTNTVKNNLGEYDDWLEIFNSGSEGIDLGGLYLTDAKDDLLKWKIPENQPDSTTISSKGFMLFYPTLKTSAGVRHTNFQFAGAGEFVGLTQIVDGATVILDSVTYPILSSDLSFGRQKDADTSWIRFFSATPGYSNTGISGLNDYDMNLTGVRIYPNPATDQLWIEIQGNQEPVDRIEIKDIFGKTIKIWHGTEMENTSYRPINWSFASSSGPEDGVYFICIFRKSSSQVGKIFICR